ncbi:2,3-diketo-5-methylthio-1-phosphopentane phosphatase [Lindgomyces ingoldianus]|uniref:2,3-diketo-5-methylthio-1-phosphopentane phosphatase n=1 Tax=Lindgomyces ingoldianus TaxID=673940 RepID=A0ACB6QGE1_9PLEO|nr:2,3-diketo-5-methylthio-1-phosphopentane phosphatase [Lindgomyces ingoldianus]KAF2466048.1 2,3-diketo-5-methylthio-1-phosphopentane phosphatase [Lindgomyces ingoldianus]
MAPVTITPPAIQGISLSSLRRQSSLSTSSIGTKRKVICFSDFDGTIFMQDTGHILFNNFGCGSERRKILDEQIYSGERTFREVSEEMWGSLDVPFDDGFEVMKEALEIDSCFHTFHKFCINNDIPFNVISAGLKPVLRRVLDHFLGEEESKHIEIVANDATISSDGSQWKPVWLHDTELGHDKAKSINDYKDSARLRADDGTIPMIVFIGDGVSDLPAAQEADVLFARRGLRLEEYCVENKLPYIPFDTFADIQREVTKIAKIDDEKTKGQGLPSNFNPRANMWRRVSSKTAIPIFAAMTPKDEKMFVWPEIFTQLKAPLNDPPLEVQELSAVAALAA